jgi:ABC-2 type transport system permease protein
MNAPRNLMSVDWFRTVATINPVSYLIEAIRSLVIIGWDPEALALGFAVAFGLIIVSTVVASHALRVRMARG